MSDSAAQMEEKLAEAKNGVDFRIATEIMGWTVTDDRFVSLGFIMLNTKWYIGFGSPLVSCYPCGDRWAPRTDIRCAMEIVEHFVRAKRGPTLYTPSSKTDEGLRTGDMFACSIPSTRDRQTWNEDPSPETEDSGYARATTMCLAICEAALKTLEK